VTSPDKPLYIDVPVKVEDVRAVFGVASLAFLGDLPAPIVHLQRIMRDIADWGATFEVVAVFHTDAGHVTLHDKAYNAERNIETGNPYKDLIAGLMGRGVHVELCGATARIHHWGNEDLLPGIKVNTDAGARMIQLVQQGFVKITE
jgi:intracellular sulfur oxidation DsrE/DsrF family protein